jgi:hypothetical protein
MRQLCSGTVEVSAEKGITYNLVHTNYWISGWVGMQLKKRQGSKQIHTYHSLGQIKYYNESISTIPLIAKTRLSIEKAVLETADRIVATSPQEKNTCDRSFPRRQH